ncbi:hypothetical protein TNIN_152191 [Trichonephila inaurata madagascariensis]|uniref:Uncharacterized protein n=1 Tax=Trichonephila inaurata madagascariensis TaxID=2747483 RepID=A0A8X7BUD7_9ARAC|nr:hypothetical protein TNIN_152191 [Trichonephila inaurata madagascariensis]
MNLQQESKEQFPIHICSRQALFPSGAAKNPSLQLDHDIFSLLPCPWAVICDTQQCLFANNYHIYIFLEENRKLQLRMLKKGYFIVACQRMQNQLQVFIERLHTFMVRKEIMFSIRKFETDNEKKLSV